MQIKATEVFQKTNQNLSELLLLRYVKLSCVNFFGSAFRMSDSTIIAKCCDKLAVESDIFRRRNFNVTWVIARQLCWGITSLLSACDTAFGR